MDEQGIRQLICELVAEALRAAEPQAGAFAATAPIPQVCEEVVRINSDHELMVFVRHLLELVKDGRVRAEIESNRRVFRLVGRSSGDHGGSAEHILVNRVVGGADAPQPARFDRGLVTERHVNAIVEGTTTMFLGKRARLTPLARDRARQKGIKIARSSE